VTRAVRRLTAALALATAVPALAYVLPAPGILRRMAQRQAGLSLSALEVSGTLSAEGPAVVRLAAIAGLAGSGEAVAVPAQLRMRVPGRCRLDLAPPDVAEQARPFVSIRDGKIVGRGGLDQLPAAVALLRATCALLATPTGGDAAAAYAAALGRRGVLVTDSSLGRFQGRIVYVIGGRANEARPLLYVAKDGFQPLRLLAPEGGALQDVRLLGWGSPAGGDWFPASVEVWAGDALSLALTTEKAAANPALPDGIFP
jgi:hypothetical protein